MASPYAQNPTTERTNEESGTMLIQAIGDLLPSAVGVALSPIPIIAVILMLATPGARTNGLAFSLGWIVGLVVVSVIVLLVAGGASDPDSGTATGVNWFQVGLGALFIAMAAGQWRKRPTRGEAPTMPTWMATIDSFTAPKALGLGAILSAANPKNLALTAAGAAAIAQAGTSGAQSAIAVAVFVVVASITVVGPVVFYLIAPRAADKPLDSIKELMSDHNAVIMMVVLLVLGAKLLGQGLGALGS
jgi:threonine/homoserine/homoserine lactone efflux protein